MSSRVRLARNLKDAPFPGWAKKPDRLRVLETIRPIIEALPEMRDSFSDTMDNLSTLDKQILVERHLVSREHAAKSAGSGLVLNRDESLCFMINEEDHLRMQALQPGLQLRQAWKMIDQADTALEKKLEYAFNSDLGYLTACPTNLGTGIASVQCFTCPDCSLRSRSPQSFNLSINWAWLSEVCAVKEPKLWVMFSRSQSDDPRETEAAIVERLEKVLAQIIEHEENARATLLEKKAKMVFNQIGRAYGILANAHSITSKETMNHLSFLRLGIDIGLFPGVDRGLVDELFILTQPAHLQKQHSEKLSAEERDVLRADMVRERLKGVSRPVPKPDEPPPSAG
jgi:protein arginine kinase